MSIFETNHRYPFYTNVSIGFIWFTVAVLIHAYWAIQNRASSLGSIIILVTTALCSLAFNVVLGWVVANRHKQLQQMEQALALETQAQQQAQNALHLSETRYRNIAELTADYAYSFMVTSKKHYMPEWITEDSFTKITGYTTLELENLGGWRQLTHPDDRLLAEKRTRKLLMGHSDITELRIVTKDGAVRWVRDYGRPIWDGTIGGVIRVYGAVQDITAQKEREDAFLQSEQVYRMRLEKAQQSSMAQAEQIVSQAQQQQGVLDRLVAAKTAELSETNRQLQCEVRALKRSAAVLKQHNLVLSSLNEWSGTMPATLEPTALLDTVVQSLAKAFDATSACIYDWDSERGLATVLAEYISPQASAQERCSNLGKSYDLYSDFTYQLAWLLNPSDYFVGHVDDAELSEHERNHMRSFGAKSMLAVPLVVADQLVGYVELWESRQRRDFTLEAIGLARSIVHQVALALENARLYECERQRVAALQAKNEVLDSFVRTVAHDLKGPIGVIIAQADLLSIFYERQEYERMVDYFGKMQKTGHMMNNLINKLSFLAHVRCTDVEPTVIDTAVVVENALTRLFDSINEMDAEIVHPQMWPNVIGWADWIEMVWFHYIDNALKYGGVPPVIEMGATPEANGMIRFWVRDNGCGLDATYQQMLFEPSARVKHSKNKGDGLGLLLVQRIIDKLGGDVGVESVAGAGCVFYFRLPQAVG